MRSPCIEPPRRNSRATPSASKPSPCKAFTLAGDGDPLGRAGGAGFLAFAHWGNGDLEAAHGFWSEAMASLQRAGHAVDAIGCNRPLAEIRVAQGRLHEAMRTYEHGLRMATDGSTVLRGAADMHVGMSELALEWNDLEAAADHLRQSDDLGDNAGLAQNPYRSRVAKAQLRLADGDGDGALALLADAQRVFVSEYYPLVRPIPAQIARIHAARGHVREAEAWVRERGLSVDDDLTYVSEYEHITLARVLLARGHRLHDPRSIQQAVALLERLLIAAETGGRWRSVVEILILQALRSATSAGARGRARAARSSADLGRAGGLRPIVRGRGCPDGRDAGGGRQARHHAGVRSSPRSAPSDGTAVRQSMDKVSLSRSASGSLMSFGCSPRILMAPASRTSWSLG